MSATLTSNQSAQVRSLAVFPAGSNGEFNLPDEMAIVIERADGCELWDTTGRRLLDFSMGWGSALVGHARPEIVAAVTAQLSSGTNFSYTTCASLGLGEELVRLSPACELVRFCASGTEATMYCLRLARAYTGKDKIVKFEGAYHGAHDVGVTSLFPQNPPDFPLPLPSCDGLPNEIRQNTLIAPFNDLEVTRRIIREHQAEVAGVIVEPLQRCLPPEPGFLEGIRELTAALDIPLIFDEVVTGFRLAYGGAQKHYGVIPDLVAYGKALGGGMPIGAFGGRRSIMEIVREDRLGNSTYVWTASSTGGNPISTSSASAALKIYRQPNTYSYLFELGEYFRDRLRATLHDHHVTAQVIGSGPLAQLIFTDPDVVIRDYRSSQHRDPQRARAVMLSLFGLGVFLNPMGTKLYLSLMHDNGACDEFCELLGRSLQATA
ncbi:MAG: aspartate aminotransferase family protein [Pirellulaceae bacterium]|nr:aspartate aminotransferase family protein [Planctomycetales bacterium]